METILVSSGYRAPTLAALRQRWHVIDIEDHAEALAYLRQCPRLPTAVAIGRVAPAPSANPPENPSGTAPLPHALPAQVMLPRVLEFDPDLPVVISTGQRRPDAIVDLIKRGAFDYVVEPHGPERDDPDALAHYTQNLVLSLTRAVQWRLTVLENRQLKQHRLGEHPDMPVQARSPAMLYAMDLVRKVAPTPATVLITGESGTGKEIIARAVHTASPRRDEPFVAVNCGALNDALLTSELFGHVRGAFTGADADRPGLVREASTGTLLLDEIATVSPAFQVMLLRVLEQRVARPVGGQREYPVRCRFLAAANRDLRQLVRRRRFREDLYYRLNVFHIDLPPLRQRSEDVPVLAHHFLRQAAEAFGKEVAGFEPAAMELLERDAWPGNVRQLRNTIERAVILCEGRRISPADLATHLRDDNLADPPTAERDYHRAMKRFETRLLRAALARAEGNLSEAARLLNMKRTTLHYRIRQLGLTRAEGG